MSGIAGIIHFDGKPIEPGLIEKMTGAMAHRGPDGINHWVKGSVALGQCMLRTTPESLEEHQPLTNEDESLVLVMDGRVDNWEELRKELLGRGAVLRTRADAELVLRAYESWGKNCLAHIDGDFALMIWDARQREAFVARDRMGHKPFFVWRSSQSLAFGSEVSAILRLPWTGAQINFGLVAEFLTQEFFSTSETLWSGIDKLPPAMCISVSSDAISENRYWSPGSEKDLAHTDDAEYIEHYRHLFLDQVRRSARSFRPIAVEVSGGLDSSAVYAGCTHLYNKGSLRAPKVLGFTFDMSEDPDFDDTEYVVAVEEFFDTNLSHVKPFVDSPEGYRARASRTLNFPGYPNGVMHLSIHDRARNAGCSALLTGIGGDEWLGGTRSYFSEELRSGRFGVFASLIRQEVEAFGFTEALRALSGDLARTMLPPPVHAALRKIIWRQRSDAEESPVRLSRARASLHASRKKALGSLTGTEKPGSQDKMRMRDYYLHPFRTFAAEQTELLGALNGLEIRHPLDSATMLDFAMRCPVRLRRRNRVDRYMHRKAMMGFLPPVVLERTSKASFDVIFSSSLKQLDEQLLPPGFAQEWLSLGTEEVSTLWRSGDVSRRVSWADWSAWSLFACSTLADVVEKQPHERTISATSTPQSHAGEAA